MSQVDESSEYLLEIDSGDAGFVKGVDETGASPVKESLQLLYRFQDGTVLMLERVYRSLLLLVLVAGLRDAVHTAADQVGHQQSQQDHGPD